MKKRQTMGKMMRDRELRERRELKQQRKDERRAGAGAEAEADGAEPTADGEPIAETPDGDAAPADVAARPDE